MTPVAISKAEGLRRFAQMTGAKPDTFQVILTVKEAFELLDHLAAGAFGQYEDQARLERDIETAKAVGDPWSILEEWTLLGMKVVRADRVLN